MTLQEWVYKHYIRKIEDFNYSNIRLGQVFANEFRNDYYYGLYGVSGFEIRGYHDKDLFFISDDKEALQMIMEWLESKPADYFENLTKDL